MAPNNPPRHRGQRKKVTKKSQAAQPAQAPQINQALEATRATQSTPDPQANQATNTSMTAQGDDCWHSSSVHTHYATTQPNVQPTGDENKDKVKPTARRFFAEKEYPPRFSLKDIEVEIGAWMCVACPASTTTCPTCKQYAGHEDFILLAIHGACISENNITQSSFGLYYGISNIENVSHVITGQAHTKQIAVLTACLRALRNATCIMDERMKMARKGNDLVPLRTFIIKTDSEYLVRGITEWLPKWKDAGWKTCKGVTVANADLFKLVEAGITVLERVVEVKFWLVPKENNKEAECLANWAIMR
ncbi:hypothetical protein PENANT_c011G07294 [Penicillium antarcticum]|uniref:ribonuclease H n=1 Tax=Penicillium antarcticum TaxID=416450 RepID=A0A1V6Q6L5_9EURO|nr:hypothetical protein PENANT_c011G07294 [Penicillium antarcticum]